MLSEVLRAGHEPTARFFHLSTPDSILMSYQAAPRGGILERHHALASTSRPWRRMPCRRRLPQRLILRPLLALNRDYIRSVQTQ
jgi:hypothetical protein